MNKKKPTLSEIYSAGNNSNTIHVTFTSSRAAYRYVWPARKWNLKRFWQKITGRL